MLRPLAKLNAGKPYAQQIKPFNFILSCHVATVRPSDRRRSGALSPHRAVRNRSAQVAALPWIDQYIGKQYRISTTLPTGTRQIARVKSYGDVLEEYEFHEEAKCADASGAPCDKQTVGLLQRRHVTIQWPPRFIGKESNKLEEVEEGSVPDSGDVYTEYPDPRREMSEWERAVAKLKAMTKSQLRLVEENTGLSQTTLKAWRRGRQSRLMNRQKLLMWLKSNKPTH